MEQEITLRDLANYLDNIGIQFLATIGLDGKPKVRPMQYNLGHVKGLENRDEFARPIHFKF